jgi:hypothetical protein
MGIKNLSDVHLVEAYRKAQEYHLEPRFIQLLNDELHKRDIDCGGKQSPS